MAPERKHAVGESAGPVTTRTAPSDTGVSAPSSAGAGLRYPAAEAPSQRPGLASPAAPPGLPASQPALEAWFADIRDSIVGAVERRFDEKTEEIARNAQKMLEQIDQDRQEQMQRLEEQLQKAQESNRRLEEQKVQVEHIVQQFQASLALAEASLQPALQQRAATLGSLGSPALSASLPDWRLPLSPPLTGLGWGPPDVPAPWSGVPTLPQVPSFSDELPGPAMSVTPSISDMAAALSTDPSISEEEPQEGSRRAWTTLPEDLMPLPPAAGAPTTSRSDVPSVSVVREATPPRKASRAAESEELIRTPPGLPSPGPRSSQDADHIPYQLRSPKPKPAPLPEEYSELTTRGLRSPGKLDRQHDFMPSPPMRPSPTPQRAGASSRSGTPGPGSRCPGTPDRSQHLLSTPKRSSRSAMGSSTPMKSPVPASPFVICEGGGCIFGFMLRLAEGVDLGVDIEHGDPPDQALHVTGIVPGGAIEAWNKQCVGGPGAGKVVMVGDKIVAVNGLSEADKMLEECRQKQMLRLTVVRGDPDCKIPSPWMPDNQRRHTVPGFGGYGPGHGQISASALKQLLPMAGAAFPGMEAPIGSPAQVQQRRGNVPPSSPLRSEAAAFVPQEAMTRTSTA